jgi:hypothetical protein
MNGHDYDPGCSCYRCRKERTHCQRFPECPLPPGHLGWCKGDAAEEAWSQVTRVLGHEPGGER